MRIMQARTFAESANATRNPKATAKPMHATAGGNGDVPSNCGSRRVIDSYALIWQLFMDSAWTE